MCVWGVLGVWGVCAGCLGCVGLCLYISRFVCYIIFLNLQQVFLHLTLVLRRGMLQPSVIFPNKFFGNRISVAKGPYGIFTYPITHLFTKIDRNLLVPYGYGESSKLPMGGGGSETP